MQPVIHIENLSKQYRLGVVGTGTLRNDLKRWWHLVRGKEDPFLKIGAMNNRSDQNSSEYSWALKDINLEIWQGDVLGIIGKNGAGKSTLLKIISRITGPTTGIIRYRGRIGSLLEVGTGFHSELTGRENIYLNGAILGMTKAEIRWKMDEIIEFSGCQRYIDTPVKRYSSGMNVRLGFAVAAHLDPEILVVDEVLAVGDADFQKKAVGKMQKVSKDEGRTVLFVSHNMQSIERLCTRTIILENGSIAFSGETSKAINTYLADHSQLLPQKTWVPEKAPGNEHARLLGARVLDFNHNLSAKHEITQNIFVEIPYEPLQIHFSPVATMQIQNDKGDIVFISDERSNSDWESTHKRQGIGVYKSICRIPGNLLAEGRYTILVAINTYYPEMIHACVDDAISFVVEDTLTGNSVRKDYSGKWPGVVRPMLKWYIH